MQGSITRLGRLENVKPPQSTFWSGGVDSQTNEKLPLMSRAGSRQQEE